MYVSCTNTPDKIDINKNTDKIDRDSQAHKQVHVENHAPKQRLGRLGQWNAVGAVNRSISNWEMDTSDRTDETRPRNAWKRFALSAKKNPLHATRWQSTAKHNMLSKIASSAHA